MTEPAKKFDVVPTAATIGTAVSKVAGGPLHTQSNGLIVWLLQSPVHSGNQLVEAVGDDGPDFPGQKECDTC